MCQPTRRVHVGRIVVHRRGAALHHPGVHIGHHHPAGVKVHGQGRCVGAANGAGRVERWASLLGAALRRVPWGTGALWWPLLLRLQLTLGSLAVLLLLLPLLLLFQELLLGE